MIYHNYHYISRIVQLIIMWLYFIFTIAVSINYIRGCVFE